MSEGQEIYCKKDRWQCILMGILPAVILVGNLYMVLFNRESGWLWNAAFLPFLLPLFVYHLLRIFENAGIAKCIKGFADDWRGPINLLCILLMILFFVDCIASAALRSSRWHDLLQDCRILSLLYLLALADLLRIRGNIWKRSCQA